MSRWNTRNRSGFTVIELMVALVLTVIIASMAAQAIAPVRARSSVRGARDVFMALNARARATAIERGQNVFFIANAAGDSAWVQRGTVVVDKVRFMDQFGVDLQMASPVQIVCWTPRGIADIDCNVPSVFGDVVFRLNDEVAQIGLLPLGHMFKE